MARLCLLDLPRQKWVPTSCFSVPRQLVVRHWSSASDHVCQEIDEADHSFSHISRGCFWCTFFQVGGALLVQHSCPPSSPSHTPSQGRWNSWADWYVWKPYQVWQCMDQSPLLFFFGNKLPPGNVLYSAFLGTKFSLLGRNVVSQSCLWLAG